MNSRILTAVVAALFALVVTGASSEAGKPADGSRPASTMPISVVPIYDSEGPKIAVGDYSKKLTEADAKTIVDVCADLQKDRDKLRAEVMYVAAIRLYDLGHKDEAVYWFYTAQYRSRVFRSILDPDKIGGIGDEAFEFKHAYNAFDQLAGKYINGYAMGDLTKLQETLAKVRDEGKTLPAFKDIYPKIQFVDQGKWEEQNKEISDGLAELSDYIRNNGDSIRDQRKKNGVEGKY